jgi:hypothetical protein
MSGSGSRPDPQHHPANGVAGTDVLHRLARTLKGELCPDRHPQLPAGSELGDRLKAPSGGCGAEVLELDSVRASGAPSMMKIPRPPVRTSPSTFASPDIPGGCVVGLLRRTDLPATEELSDIVIGLPVLRPERGPSSHRDDELWPGTRSHRHRAADRATPIRHHLLPATSHANNQPRRHHDYPDYDNTVH